MAARAGAVSAPPAVSLARLAARSRSAVLGTLGIALFLAAWQGAANVGLINPVVASSPSAVWTAFVHQASSGELLGDLWVSVAELAIGFGLAIVCGVGLGIVMGLNATAEYAFDPFVWFLYSAPLIALYPLLVVWLGFGFGTVVAITFILTVVSLIPNTVTGVQSVEPSLIRAVRAFGGSEQDVVRKVVLPSALPLIMAGIRIGLGRALIGVVLGEMFSSNAGLGFRTSFYGAHLRTADTLVPLIVFVVLGVVLTQALKLLERHFQAWKR